MTTLTDEQLADLRARITKGPWTADGPPWNRIIWSEGENRVCFMAHSDGLNDDRDIATSELIAMSPDLLDEVVRLREALAPFSRMAGLLFSINKNSPDVVLSVKARSGEDQLTAGDFFAARRALTTEKNDG